MHYQRSVSREGRNHGGGEYILAGTRSPAKDGWGLIAHGGGASNSRPSAKFGTGSRAPVLVHARGKINRGRSGRL
jgi:hypothetical protein